ncbi:MAG TPA: type II toxin-antitoxin system prevent-host-death family antitoxin [Gemmatimonadaceae bacterium]|nr:type II toxin-antitoxin system prevent-host-death family antitoxin [Gemmatimonadaceae bacterium]
MAKPLNLYDAKTHLSELVDRAAAGEEFVIAKSGTPLARLVPLQTATSGRAPGRWSAALRIAPDFDAPLPADVAAAFDGRDS